MIAAPRVLVAPESVKSAGPQLVKLAAVAGVGLDHAQQLVADVACGVGADGKWSAYELVCFQPRQNGKSELAIMRILAGLTLFREDLVCYSAHQARTTHKVFERLHRVINQCPELGARIKRVSRRLGSEVIELKNGRTLECVARSGGTGRGYTGDCILLDEAHELDADQLAALTPMLSTRPNPQIWYLLSQGNLQSWHLSGLRHRALNGAANVAWLEWSMDPDEDSPADRSKWADWNPGVLSGRISTGFLEKQFDALGPERFGVEHCGWSVWPTEVDGQWAVISKDAWERCRGDDGPVLPLPERPLASAPVPVVDELEILARLARQTTAAGLPVSADVAAFMVTSGV